ncbi:MAG: tRNA (N(6)-L-threonylcarbamoyladenosine(37)-C(2))-methylthiotransferase MtaB [Thermaerobacter sp.]|nr:tRNA (N(6)-L-threonylcarbamoyladenosine(37)-C(2))-methylthiotransferase MtaB [Thermaerobacter sp.]
MLTVGFYTLGCKVNQQETSALAAKFKAALFREVDFASPADIYVINTCVVTSQAERKSRALAKRQKKKHPTAFVVLAGCFPQVARDKAAALGMELVVGSNDKGRIVELVKEALAERPQQVHITPWSANTAFEVVAEEYSTDRARATLKVQDGCEQYCAYCIIPYARGPERSLPLNAVQKQAEALLQQGYKEIILSGIHLGAYGRDLTPELSLATLAETLAKLPGLVRLRLGSVEPTDVTTELITTLARHENICRHLHIPLQSGSTTVLGRMGRPYTTAGFSAITSSLRQLLPDIGITSDVIVGFPGETVAEHEESLAFVKAMEFARVHVFRYSRRPGTRAAEMKEQILDSVKDARYEAMQALTCAGQESFHASHLGKTVAVLVENEPGELRLGHTSSYLKVAFPGPSELMGEVVSVKVLGTTPDGVYGEVAK